MRPEEIAFEALRLFREGNDTLEITKGLQISEARASKLLWWVRCKEKGLPAEFIGDGHRRRIAA